MLIRHSNLKIFFAKTLLVIIVASSVFGFPSSPFGGIGKSKTAYASCSSEAQSAGLSAQVGGVALNQAAQFLADMSDITGAYYDAIKDRIVFVGKQNTSAPQFDKDDLAVAIRTLFFNNTIPYVSIDFKDLNNIAGDPNMKVTYSKGIEDTHFGKVLFDADSQLKVYFIGFYANGQQIISSVPGYKSHLERWLELGPDFSKSAISRWWITPKDMIVKRDSASNAFVFEKVSMQVQTQPLSSNNDPAWNQAAAAFAQHHTDNYDLFAVETPAYFEAKQLGKIVSIVKWLKDNNIATDFQWARDYQPEFLSTPKEVPRITSPIVEINGYWGWMTGGVDYYTPTIYNPDDGTAASLKASSEAVNAPKEEVHWQFNNGGQQYEAVAVAANAFRSLGGYGNSVIDLSAPAVGDLDLAFGRSYSSFSGAQNGIGLGWEMLPARLMDARPGWTSACSSPPTGGPYPWKLAFQSQSAVYESFTFSCNGIYVADKPEYHSKLFRNADGSFSVKLPNQTEFVFDVNLRLQAVKDKTGTGLNYSYDASGRLVAIADAKGHALNLSYNPQNLVSEITDWTGRKVRYVYDSPGNLISVADSNGGATAYAYDANNKLTQIKNRLNQTVLQNTYTEEAKLASQANAAGLAVNYTYDEANKTILSADSNGRTSKVVYDDKARVLESFDALGNSAKYTYGQELYPLSAVDPRGNQVDFTYDFNGNLMSVTLPTGKAIVYNYDANNRPTKITDYRYGTSAKETLYVYDGVGNLIQKNQAGILSNYTYDAYGQPLTLLNHLNQKTVYSRNDFGGITSVIDPLNQVLANEYDALGRLVKQTDESGKVVSFAYDANGNLVAKTDASGATAFEYDAENQLKKETSASGAVTQYSYNSAASLTGVTDALLNATSYGYDIYQNLTSQQDALLKTTQFAYDALNRPTQETSPLGKTSKWEYDQNGNIAKRTDPKQQTTTYTYDVLNRLTVIFYPDGKQAVFTYDDRGNVTKMADAAGAATYAYDNFDRLTQSFNSFGQTLTYGYDAIGNLKTLSYPGNKAANYAYDANNRLQSAADWNGEQTAYTYFPNGALAAKNFPNGVSANYTYDGSNRLASLEYKKNGTSFAKFTYTRNAVGNITQVKEEGSALGSPTPAVADFTYDALNRLAQAAYPSGDTYAYVLDKVGNRLTMSQNASSTSYAYNDGHQLINTNTKIYNYDDNGNLISVAKSPNQNSGVMSASSPASAIAAAIFKPLIFSFTATPSSITEGSSTKLAWILFGGAATALTIDQGVGSVLGSSSKTVSPVTTTTYTLTASNAVGSSSQSVTVTVNPKAPVIDSFAANPPSIATGQSTALFWTLSGGAPTSLSIDQGVGSVLGSSSKTVSPATTTIYTLTAKNAAGTATKKVTVTVTEQPPIINSFTAIPATITAGQSAALTWSLSGGAPASLSIDQGVGNVLGLTSVQVAPSTATTYILTAANAGGSMAKQVTVSLGPSPQPSEINLTWDSENRLLSFKRNEVITTISTATSTLTFYPAAGDGSIYHNSSSSWDAAHDAATGSSANYTSTTGYVRTGKTLTNRFQIERVFLPFNTAALPDNANVVSAKLKVYVNSKKNDDNDSDDWLTVVQSSQPSATSLATADYDLAGSINSPGEGVDATERKDITGITTGQYLTFNLNPTGLSWISKTGFTKLALREGHDVIDSPFSGLFTKFNEVAIRTSEYSGTASDPVLEVTYTTTTVATSTPPTVYYAYDALGNRLQKVSGSQATRYVNDTSGKLARVLAETNASNTAQSYYLYGQGLISSGPAASSTRAYLLSDGLGNVRFITDAVGNITSKYDYDPFGNIRSVSGTASNNYQFQSEQLDPESSLYFLRARYYDPNTGRFISKDPVKGILSYPQSLNPYQYAYNDPVNLSDPSGMLPGWLQRIGNAINDSCLFNYMVEHPFQGGLMVAAGSGLVLIGGSYLAGVGYTGLGIGVNTAATVGTTGTVTCASGGCQKAVDFVIKNSDKMDHIFKEADHGFGSLVTQLGSRENVVRAIMNGLGEVVTNAEGIFEKVVSVNGTDVVVRGSIVDGIVRVGTMFIPK